MTREEIVEGLKLLEDNMVHFDELQNNKGEWIDVHELLFESIQALLQEPCDDAVEDAGNLNQSNACSILDDECPYPHKHCWECPLNYQYELAKHELDKNVDLPSVTQKSGKWQRVSIEKYIQHAMAYYECSECGVQTIGEPKYCPNCGAKMESEE